jgi:hypothetical protein
VTIPTFQDKPPETSCVNPYDERHLVTYLRLLDASAENEDWREIVSVIFGLDATLEPDRAKTVYETHLARAKWMTESGYKDLR